MSTVTITFYEDLESIIYHNVRSIEIIGGERAEQEIEPWTDESSRDKFHTYLVLHLADLETATFRFNEVIFKIK